MSNISIVSGDQIVPSAYQQSYGSNRPRAVVALNGTRYPCVEFSLEKNAHGATDTGSVALPISSQDGVTPGQDFSALFSENSDLTPVYVQIYAGYPSDPVPYSTDISQLQSRFIGIVDAYTAAFEGDRVTFSIRSLAAPMVDVDLTKMTPSMTSIAFAQQQASALGLTLQASKLSNPVTVQETLAHEFIGGSNINVAVYKMKPWDLLLQMAQFDDVDVWVDGSTLYYMAPYDVQRSTVALEYGRDFAKEQLNGTHSIEFNRKVRVEVRSYQPRTKTSHVTRVETNTNGGTTTTQTVRTVTSNPIFGTNETLSSSYNPSTGVTTTNLSSASGGNTSSTTSADSESGLLIYKVYRPNLSPARAAALAASLWRQYSMHLYGLQFTLPATPQNLPNIAITSLFSVSKLPYQGFNDKFWPRKISENFDLSSAYRFAIEALNAVLPQGAV